MGNLTPGLQRPERRPGFYGHWGAICVFIIVALTVVTPILVWGYQSNTHHTLNMTNKSSTDTQTRARRSMSDSSHVINSMIRLRLLHTLAHENSHLVASSGPNSLKGRLSIVKGGSTPNCTTGDCNPLYLTLKDPHIFDTGVHILGAHSTGQNRQGRFVINVTRLAPPTKPISTPDSKPNDQVT